jgi:hypothetical protein
VKKLAAAVIIAIMTSLLVAAPAQATYEDRAAWVAWFNVQDAYFRCTAHVAPPVGFTWGSDCLMVPYYY